MNYLYLIYIEREIPETAIFNFSCVMSARAEEDENAWRRLDQKRYPLSVRLSFFPSFFIPLIVLRLSAGNNCQNSKAAERIAKKLWNFYVQNIKKESC